MSIAPPTDPATPPTDPATPPTDPGAPPHRSQRLIIVLLIVIAFLLAAIAGLLLIRELRKPQQVTTASPTATQPSTAQETSAPSLTDARTLEVAHGEVTRNPDDARAKGNADAPVVMVVYSDFACPFCTRFAQEVEPELADLIQDGTLRIEWRDLAQITETSPLAAQAGIAAGNQGKFWEFHDAVYAAADPQDHPEYTEDSLVEFARQAGVPDVERFRTDMNDAATVTAVNEATQHAHDIGIQGTPFLIVNDAAINGFRPVDYVRNTIAEQAANVS